jgi:DNA mismatch endonuclease (patch repair protein)
LRRTADIAFTKAKVAVMVDGCFWHSCPDHGTLPLANRDWWSNKLAGNAERDRETTASWTKGGWTVLRFWEHDDPERVADIVERALGRGEHP